MNKARLIIDEPADGPWNMAVDQALLETADRTGQITLRFYQWDQPTLSLGYFQSHHDRSEHPASLRQPLVRRRTGGGAILHHHELTYSLCVPSSNRWSKKNFQLYRSMHQSIVELLASDGIESELYEPAQPAVNSGNAERSAKESNPFMCFHRRSDGDIVLGGNKIVGSAQRRLKNALLQHGSILLRRSEFAPDLPGISDLGPLRLKKGELVHKLADAVACWLQCELEVAMISTEEIGAAERVCAIQFKSDAWNLRR